MTDDALKRCGSCKTERPRAEFSPAPSAPDGLSWRCKKCNAARSRVYRSTLEGRERANARTRRTVAGYRARNLARNSPGTIAAA